MPAQRGDLLAGRRVENVDHSLGSRRQPLPVPAPREGGGGAGRYRQGPQPVTGSSVPQKDRPLASSRGRHFQRTCSEQRSFRIPGKRRRAQRMEQEERPLLREVTPHPHVGAAIRAGEPLGILAPRRIDTRSLRAWSYMGGIQVPETDIIIGIHRLQPAALPGPRQRPDSLLAPEHPWISSIRKRPYVHQPDFRTGSDAFAVRTPGDGSEPAGTGAQDVRGHPRLPLGESDPAQRHE